MIVPTDPSADRPCAPRAEADSEAPMTRVDRFVPLAAGRLFVRRWTPSTSPDAAAPPAPVLLFHDSLGAVGLWRDFPERLARATGREVVAYDRLGFGRSDPRNEPPSVDFVAEEAAQVLPTLLAQLGIDRVVALGHSVGGGMAVHAAARLANRCEALVTLSAQFFPEGRTLEGVRAAREQFRDPAQRERLARHHGERADWVLAAWTDVWLQPAFADWSLAPVLPAVRCPLLAIHGEDDEFGSPRHPRLIAAHAAGPSRVLLLPGVRHVPHREQPDTVLAAVRDFLAEPDRARP